uniref:Mediator of RNA polymerase II transcription subunit 16 n=1 Tax=Ornithorhynchus anatinus TaxID=9258 RepID=A0A6I8P7B7_ORNAN
LSPSPRPTGMMDLAYICEWEKCPKSNHCPSIPLVCAWSCRNLIAFTTDLKNEEEKDLRHMIHILDTEHPWDVYSINSEHNEIVTCLEWDQSGSRLLSADADGQIKCWSMSDHLANSWENSVGSMVEGDPVVSLSWLHNGVKLALHVEKSGASSFGEKFSRVKFSPSLTLFGGKCGCVTMLKSPNKTTAVKQWEQRWIKNCLCGGLWRRVPFSYS